MSELTDLQRKIMEKNQLDAMVAMTPENITYLTGTEVPTQQSIRSRQVFHIVTMENDPEVIVVNIEESLMVNQSWIPQNKILSYNEFTQDPMMLAIEKLKELGMDNKKVGFELSFLPTNDYILLNKNLPSIELVDADPLFEEMRQIKLNYEIDLISDFGEKIEDVIYDAFASVKAGMTEKDLYNFLLQGFNEIGGDALTVPVVASGERSCFLNGEPTDRVLKKGDIVRVDMIGKKQGYYCDCCRTAVVGEPEDYHIDIWNKLVKAHDDAVESIKPGASSKAIYDNYVQQFNEFDLTPIEFIGHGLGISLHEEPFINTYQDIALKENMVLCIEPIYINGETNGFQLENEVLVTPNGYKLLTGSKHPYDKLPIISL